MDPVALLAGIPPNTFLGVIDAADRDALLAGGTHRRYRPGDVVYRAGDDAGGALVLLEGLVTTSTADEHGRAAWAGASREAVSKALGVLRALGSVRTGRRRIEILDPDALRRRAR